MRFPRITQLMRGIASFTHYEDARLWYRITWEDDSSATHDFDFPIPVDDTGGGKFLPTAKAITLMRWIRKHLEYLNGALGDARGDGVFDQ